MHECLHVCACMSVCMCVHVCVHVFVYACMQAVHACMCVCMCNLRVINYTVIIYNYYTVVIWSNLLGNILTWKNTLSWCGQC